MTQACEYAVLVANTAYDLQAIAQLYRNRADCENGFDELKSQWGRGGFSTQDIERCQTPARSVALIYTLRVREPAGQLVELVLSGSQTGYTNGGHYQ